MFSVSKAGGPRGRDQTGEEPGSITLFAVVWCKRRVARSRP